MEEINSLMNTWPPDFLRTDNVSPCDLTINQSENCAQVGDLPCDPHLASKNALLKLFGEFGAF